MSLRRHAPLRILGITGSLRAGASHTSLLEAAALVAPIGMRVDLYPSLGALPHFNPDLDREDGVGLPSEVAALRALVGRADGLLFCTPEYAHGLPGTFKNLLDWLVGSLEFPFKPVAMLNTSTASVHAPAQLAETLRTMSGRLVLEACVTIPVSGRGPRDPRSIAEDAVLNGALRAALGALAAAATRV